MVFFGDFSVVNVLVFVVGLVLCWVVVLLPVHVAGKVVSAGESTLGDAMVGSLLGPVVYAVALGGVDLFLGSVLVVWEYVFALGVAFVVWGWFFRRNFRAGWLSGFLVAVLAVLVFASIGMLLGFLLGVMVPTPFFPRF